MLKSVARVALYGAANVLCIIAERYFTDPAGPFEDQVQDTELYRENDWPEREFEEIRRYVDAHKHPTP